MTRISIAGHMGELLQGRLGPSGPVVLITLPAPHLRLEVQQRTGAFSLYQPSGRIIDRAKLHGLYRAAGCKPKGRWVMRALMPIGAGAGASTAALVGLAKALRPDWTNRKIEEICLRLEGASDPLLARAPERILWASREGRKLQELPKLPPMQVVGGFVKGRLITDPSDQNFPDVSDLVQNWAFACRDLTHLGEIVTEASRRRLRQWGEDMTPLITLAKEFGAKGLSIAHTGTARAFLLPADSAAAPSLAQHLRHLGWHFVQNYKIGGS